jgi:hypothetical protein
LTACSADLLIEDLLCENKLDKHFYVKLIPVAPSVSVLLSFCLVAYAVIKESDYQEGRYTIMLVRRKSPKRVWIPQQLGSQYDLAGRDMIKKVIGLEVSAWRTFWYNDMAHDPPYEAEFLKPGFGTGKGKAKSKSGSGVKKNKVKAKSKAKSRAESNATSSEEGDWDGKGCITERYKDQGVCVEGGRAEGTE